MDEYSLAFSASNIGPKTFQKLLSQFGTPEKAWSAKLKSLESIGINGKTLTTFENFRKRFDYDKYAIKMKKDGIHFISFTDAKYPKELKGLENPPIGLFCKGNIKLLSHNLKIAVVGTRKITQYGQNVTELIVSGLGANDVCIVSGLALGVDGTAHKVAIQNSMPTIAVLACGVDCCRPSENYSLYSAILKKDGLIISEYPLSQPPNKGTFLARNRIVAALSKGIVITEASEDSGSLVTADWGFRLNKKVFAIPGMVTSQMSKGSLKLLKQGAKLVTEGEDILKEFKIQKIRGKIDVKKLTKLNGEEKKIIALLQIEEMAIDDISKNTKIPVSKLFIAISNLELKGILKSERGKFGIMG